MHLREIRPEGFTWHNKAKSKEAALDHALLFAPSEYATQASATSLWLPETTLDHAMVTLTVPRQLWGQRLQLDETGPTQTQKRIKMQQWTEHEEEWNAQSH